MSMLRIRLVDPCLYSLFVLVTGLENIGKNIVGESKWEKLYDGCPTPSSSSSLMEQEPEVPKDVQGQLEKRDTRESSPTPSTGLPVETEGDEEEEQQDLRQGVDKTEEQNAHSNEGSSQSTEIQQELSTEVELDETQQEEGNEEEENNRGELSSNVAADLSDSPHSAQALETPGDKNNVGAANAGLVDNLFQILPYWYLLNRAFGLSNPDGAEDDMETQDTETLEEDRQEENDDGGSRMERRLHEKMAELNNPHLENCSSAATQRLNSILILESLRRQIQNSGQTGFGNIGQTVQQGYLSELIGRMGGEDVEGSHSWLAEHGHTREASEELFGSEAHDMEEQPLDLTRGNSRELVLDGGPSRISQNSTVSAASDKCPPPLILDEHTSKVFRSNPRSSKGYTAQELQAALHDIQSGKLGTRRAAVIYGIPRSTLRNKVYKLGKDRGRVFTANHVSPRTTINNNSLYNNKESCGSASIPLSTKLSHHQGVNPDFLVQEHGYDGPSNTTRFHNSSLQLSDEEQEEGNQGLYWNRRSIYSLCNREGDGEGQRDEGTIPPKIPSIISQSSLSQLIAKPSKRTHSHQSYHQQIATSSPSSMDIGVDESCLGGGEIEHGGVGRLLNQQFFGHRQRAEALGRVAQTRGAEHQNNSSPLLHSHQRQAGPSEDVSQSHDLAGKKSRPKRGKYRNYDREALIKAVRAVQNGEMSVHRAGSFFGVPHSTLEYKVKERHLLRRPKRKEVTSPLSHTKSSSPENSSDATSLSSSRHASAPPTSISAFSKTIGASKGGTAPTAAASNVIKRHCHQPMFPLTSDLRESLNRYLSADQETNGSHNYTSFQSQFNEIELEDGLEEEQVIRTCAVSRRSQRSESELIGLDGLIGNRLSNLFHINEILVRNKNNGAVEPRENLLDLSKK
ncbi:unnamed protein product [Orchesella dallaii]|uniref:HTH psq-type domain-containing protein n=1 Tax=Orchesella dallaii TaxID=48710 RepID=A0ABP1R910_9HEXA